MLALRRDMSMSKDMQDRWWAKVGFATNIFRKVGRRENVQEHPEKFRSKIPVFLQFIL